MGSIFSKFLNKEVDLLIDLRSSGVGVAIAEISKTEIKFLYSKRYRVFYKTEKDSEKFINEISKNLDSVLSQVSSKEIQNISEINKISSIRKVHVFISSPWYVSKTKTVEIKQETPFVFNEKMFENILQKENISSKEDPTKYIIEKDITQVILNGYELHDPFGQKTKEIKLSFYVSMMQRQTAKVIGESIKKYLPKSKVKFHTHGSVLFNSIRNNFINLNNYVLLDIGGELTDISVVQDGALKEIMSMPYGKHDFIRNISSKCKLETSVIESSLRMLAKGELETKCNADILSLFKKEESVWSKKITDSLNDTEVVKEIPKKICLIADDDFIEIAEKLTKSDSLRKGLYDDASIGNIITLNNKDIKSSILYNKNTQKDFIFNLLGDHISFREN